MNDELYPDGREPHAAVYQRVGDTAYGLVIASLVEGEERYGSESLDSLCGAHRTDHLPHLLRHAVKAYLAAGFTRNDALRETQIAWAEYDCEEDEDHLAHAVCRATQESIRQDRIADSAALEPPTGAITVRRVDCPTADESPP